MENRNTLIEEIYDKISKNNNLLLIWDILEYIQEQYLSFWRKIEWKWDLISYDFQTNALLNSKSWQLSNLWIMIANLFNSWENKSLSIEKQSDKCIKTVHWIIFKNII